MLKDANALQFHLVASNPIQVIRRTSDFARIRESGKRLNPSRWMTIGYIQNNLDFCRYGWTVSRKTGSAVTRNRLKRWCRTYFRSVDGSLNNSFDINIVFKPNGDEFYKKVEHAEFIKTIEKGWDGLSKIV